MAWIQTRQVRASVRACVPVRIKYTIQMTIMHDVFAGIIIFECKCYLIYTSAIVPFLVYYVHSIWRF